MLRNTLQISIGASLTSPDHWLNYPDLRLIILGLIIFSLRKKITENSLQNYQNYIHAPACYFGASTPSESPFLLRRIHLHFFALRVILNLDGLVLGPRTRRDWWDDVLDGLHLVDRLATLWVWLDHGGPSYPPSWHSHRNVPLSILRNNRLLRDVHGEIFFFLLDFGRILGGYLGGYLGGCLGDVLGDRYVLGGRRYHTLDTRDHYRRFSQASGFDLLSDLAFSLRRTLGLHWQSTGVFDNHPGDFARHRCIFFGTARTHCDLHLHVHKISRHFCLGGSRRTGVIRWHHKAPFLDVGVHRALALGDKLRLLRALHALPLPRPFGTHLPIILLHFRRHLFEDLQYLPEKFFSDLGVRVVEVLDDIDYGVVRVAEPLMEDVNFDIHFPEPRLEVVNLGALYGATSPANGNLLRLGANGFRCSPNDFLRHILSHFPRRQRTPNFLAMACRARRSPGRVVFWRHHARVLVGLAIIAF